MSESSNSKRGLWEGIPPDLLKPGINCGNPNISPDGNYLSFTLTLKEDTLFIARIKNNFGISDLKQVSQVPLSTGTPYGGGLYCWTSDSSGFVFTSKGKLQSLAMKTDDHARTIFENSSQLAYAPSVSKNFLTFSVEKKTTMAIGLISTKTGVITDEWPQQLNFFANFIYDPQISPDEKDILFHYWNFPNMSWNGSKIVLIPIKELINNEFKEWDYNHYNLAGSETVATSQPRFSPDGKYITFLNEENGWLNLWISRKDGTDIRPVLHENREHSYSTWVTGGSSYTWLPNSKELIFSRNSNAFFSLSKINIETNELIDLPLSKGVYSDIWSSRNLQNPIVTAMYTDYKSKSQILLIDPYSEDSRTVNNVIFTSTPNFSEKRKDSMIKPEAISFPTSDNSTAHGLLYLASDNNGKRENAPVVMYVHGGPTGMATNNFNSIIQYLATRGYAVFAINHRGSIGYGKDYREVLNGNWGSYDVNDTIDALNYLAKQGYVNKNKSCILGGSAGGFTVLISLVKKPGIYSAGVDLFGVSDNFGLAEDTHYLESRYSDILLGPLPEASQKYVEQSAIFHADKISDPLLIFQGADDKVVPKNQSELIKSKVKGYV
ncbi:MAG: S9 family peptidase, partial [Candidatus Hodarchaeales archaeon]